MCVCVSVCVCVRACVYKYCQTDMRGVDQCLVKES